EVPYAEWSVRDAETFRSFPDRVHATLGGLVSDPILDEFWPHVEEFSRATDLVGLRFALARRKLEATRGVRNAEVPLSRLCETEAFGWFTCHLLADLPRFHRVHNDALARYR